MILVAAFALATAPAFGADAGALWSKHCASCHGMNGSGNTAMGRKTGVQDYRNARVQASFNNSEAFATIKSGVKRNRKVRMKGYAHKLSDNEIRALVAYIRHFRN